MLYQKQIETRYETDILIVGGGAAGVAAAVAAARMGKKVLLVESNGCFGGVALWKDNTFISKFLGFKGDR